MLSFLSSDGYTTYVGHMISALIVAVYVIGMCVLINKKITDKFLHSAVCAAITFVMLHIAYFTHLPWWIAPLTAYTVGICKEIYDRIFKVTHLFDWMDILADVCGLSAVTLVYVFSFLLS